MPTKDERREVRAALKWWRLQHPGVVVRSIHHGWYGWVLVSTDARYDGVPVARMQKVIEEYRRSQLEAEEKTADA